MCYYSDQRDPAYGQKLAHQTTSNLVSWSAAVDDVHDTTTYAARPGMPAVARLPDGNYVFAYELCGTDGCRVHYRLGRDPLGMLGAPPAQQHALVSTAGGRPVSSPFVVWAAGAGGANGTLVLSGGGGSQVYTNTKLGDPAAWVEHPTPQPGAYSRGLAVLGGDGAGLLLIGAGRLPPSSTNRVSVSVLDLRTLVGS